MSPFLDSVKSPSHQQTAHVRHGHPDRRPSRAFVVRRVVALVILVVCAVSVWVIPAARRELRESFTRLPSSYTELYFTSAPVIEHTQVLVPVTVVGHGDSKQSYRLHVWLESDGRTTASTTTTLTGPLNTRASMIAHLPRGRGSLVVHVALLGRSQELHFRLGTHGSGLPKGSS